MAEFEPLDELTQNVKKMTKNKPFLFACIGVGVFALYMGMKKKKDDTGPYEAIGYAGYPSTGDSTTFSEMDYIDQSLLSMYEQMERDKQDTDRQLADLLDAIDKGKNSGNNYGYSAPVASSTVQYEKQAKSDYDRVMEQMKANSDAWHIVTDQATKDKLHAENERLGASIGLTYDDGGTWWNGDSIAYVTPLQQAVNLLEKQTAATHSSSVSFEPNVDYQARINEAIINGADAAVINNLNAQRNAKITATGQKLSSVNQSYDKNTDYMALINQAKASGADQSVIDNLTAMREAKIADLNK